MYLPAEQEIHAALFPPGEYFPVTHSEQGLPPYPAEQAVSIQLVFNGLGSDPLPHAVHEVLPRPEANVSAAQSAQPVEPSPSVYFPASQSSHGPPVPLFPAGHGLHTRSVLPVGASVSSWPLPQTVISLHVLSLVSAVAYALRGTRYWVGELQVILSVIQLGFPASLCHLPRRQSLQDKDAAKANFPAIQSEHVPPLPAFPAGQVSHSRSLVAEGVTLSCWRSPQVLQVVHESCPVPPCH